MAKVTPIIWRIARPRPSWCAITIWIVAPDAISQQQVPPIHAGARVHAVPPFMHGGLPKYGAVPAYRVGQSSCRLSSPELAQEECLPPGAGIARSAACV